IKGQMTFSSTDFYELYKVEKDQKALLILFPGMGGNAENIRASFDVLEAAEKNQVSVLLLNFTNLLFLDEEQKLNLTERVNQIIAKEKLNTDHVCIGGFSSGGLMSVLWSDYLIESKSNIDVQKVFLVDSPLDLVQLYTIVTDVDENSHDMSKREADYLIGYFQERLPQEGNLLDHIAKVSPYLEDGKNFENIKNLKNLDFRIYTEPDSAWWKENRGSEYKESNAFLLENFKGAADAAGWKNVELIKTKDKGYRANGDRHPHSWSIVDSHELMLWIGE
ncbi:MAG: hypothetical protein ACPGWM_04530, partial [Flavobacteriales bacterium]